MKYWLQLGAFPQCWLFHQSGYVCFNCPFHLDCLVWNPTPDKYYMLSVEEMHCGIIFTTHNSILENFSSCYELKIASINSIFKGQYVNWCYSSGIHGLANCLSFPESIVSDYSVLDHWNVPRRLPEFLTAASFITANVTAIAKHWFCCFLSLLLCPFAVPLKVPFCCYCYDHQLHFPAMLV